MCTENFIEISGESHIIIGNSKTLLIIYILRCII